jgi:hypothetical protein
MSHFSVLVIVDEEPTEKLLHKVLLPWHEYECTGYKEFVRWVDRTVEVTTKYAVLDEKKRKEYPTLALFAKKWYGCEIRADGQIGRMTNPDKKWDWWVIGGRYSGKLRVKQGAEARIGERSWTNKNEAITGVDAALRGSLDLDAMKRDQQDGRREWAEDCCAKAERTIADLDIALHIQSKSNAEWQTLPEPRPRGPAYIAWLESHGGEWPILAAFQAACWSLPEPSPNQSLSEWIEAAPAISAWAVVMDNQWFEKGKMGWWGMSSDDKAGWEDHFSDLFGLIRDDRWVVIVDCHI